MTTLEFAMFKWQNLDTGLYTSRMMIINKEPYIQIAIFKGKDEDTIKISVNNNYKGELLSNNIEHAQDIALVYGLEKINEYKENFLKFEQFISSQKDEV